MIRIALFKISSTYLELLGTLNACIVRIRVLTVRMFDLLLPEIFIPQIDLNINNKENS